MQSRISNALGVPYAELTKMRREGFEPPMFTAWVTLLQSAAFNQFSYQRKVLPLGVEPSSSALQAVAITLSAKAGQCRV